MVTSLFSLTAVAATGDAVAEGLDEVPVALELPSWFGLVVDDPTARAGVALMQHSTSTASASVPISGAPGRLVVRVRGEQCDGAPQVRVLVDGQERLSTQVTAERWTDLAVPSPTVPGRAYVEVVFTNDRWTGTCDRNLFTDGVTFAPHTQQGPAPASRPVAGAVRFDADVATKGLSAYASVVHPERISIVDDPLLGASRKVMRFTVHDGDIGPTANPRAQVETPKVFAEGDDIYIGWSTLFPSDWPERLPSGGSAWITLSELYGPPYAGAAPVKIGQRSGSAALSWQRNSSYGWDVQWESAPIKTNTWYDQVLHVKLSADPAVGFVELFVNTGAGWQQQLLGGQVRRSTRTLDASNGAGNNYHKLALYRLRGMYPVLTVFHAEHRVGTTFDAAAPHTYG